MEYIWCCRTAALHEYVHEEEFLLNGADATSMVSLLVIIVYMYPCVLLSTIVHVWPVFRSQDVILQFVLLLQVMNPSDLCVSIFSGILMYRVRLRWLLPPL